MPKVSASQEKKGNISKVEEKESRKTTSKPKLENP